VGDLDLLVPAYVHPLEDPGAWDRLVSLAPVLRAVDLGTVCLDETLGTYGTCPA